MRSFKSIFNLFIILLVVSCVPAGKPKEGSKASLQELVDEAKVGSTIDISGKELSNYTASIDKSLTLKGSSSNKLNLKIEVPSVTLDGIEATDVDVDKSVGDGDLTIRDSQVNDLLVAGGGANSIHIEGNCVINKTNITKVGVRLYIKSKTAALSEISVDANCKIEAVGTTLERIATTAKVETLELAGCSIENIVISGETTLLVGKSGNITTAIDTVESANDVDIVLPEDVLDFKEPTVSGGGTANVVTATSVVFHMENLVYHLGEEFDFSCLLEPAEVMFSDGSIKEFMLNATHFTGFDTTTLGEKDVILTIAGVSKTFTISVVDDRLTFEEKPIGGGYSNYIVGYRETSNKNPTLELPKSLGGSSAISIKEGGFQNLSWLEAVIAPAMSTIGANAFKGCSNLKTLVLEGSYTATIESSALDGTAIESIYIPSGNFGEYKSKNPDLEETLLKGMDNSKLAFTYVEAVANKPAYYKVKRADDNIDGEVVIPPTYLGDKGRAPVTTIEEKAFFCSSSSLLIESVHIPNSITTIGSSAFSMCPKLKEITIPASVETIGESAFSNCKDLIEINVDSENKAFSSRDGILYNKSKTTLIACATKKVGSINVPEGVITIGKAAFQGTSVETLILPASLKSIEIGGMYTGSLKSVTISAITPPVVGTLGLEMTNVNNIYVPTGSVEAYKVADGWKVHSAKISAITP